MNKFFTRIVGAALGLAMAIGVGVAVSHHNLQTAPLTATSATWELVTAAPNDWSGQYILCSGSSGTVKMMNVSSFSGGANFSGSDVTVTNGKITADDSNAITISSSVAGTSGKYTIIANGYWIGKNSGSGNGVDSLSTSGTYSANYNNAISYGNNKVTIAGNGGRTLTWYGQNSNFRYYASSNNCTQLFKKTASPQTITVDPSSNEAYVGENISLTTNAASASWALSNNTCDASLSSSSGKTITVSATSAGTVRVTATASGYTSPYVDLTFNEKPSSPFITLSKNSTSGYTEQNESISFTYGNLTSSLSVISNNTSVVTVGNPSVSAGSGSVQINFVGQGSTTVKFKDGSTELASLSVTVATSSVTITGLPAEQNVYIGKTINLASYITVTAIGAYSNDVTWESADDSIATVSDAGVVSGVSKGNVSITVISDDYPSASMTCDVTVDEAPLKYEVYFGTSEGTSGITDFSNTSFVIPSEVTLDNIQGNVYGSTTNQSASLRFGKGGTTGSFDASIGDGYYIKKIIANLKYYGSDGTTTAFDVTPEGGDAVSHTLTGSFANYEYDVASAYVNKVSLGTSINGKRAYLSGFNILYDKTWSKLLMDNLTCSGATVQYPDGHIIVENPTAVWNSISTAFANATDAQKEAIKTEAADPSESATIEKQALAKYDLVIKKYGTSTYADFLGRFQKGGINYNGARISERLADLSGNGSLVTIIIVSMVGLTAIIGFVFISKRKQR